MDKTLVEPYISKLNPIPTNMILKGNLQKSVSVLMCDIYGTLFISGCGDIGVTQQKKIQYQALNKLLAGYNIDRSPSDIMQTLYTAIQTEHKTAQDNGITYPEIQIDKVWSDILPSLEMKQVREFAMEFEMVVNPVWPMPGLMTLIDTCRQNDIRLGIISNAQFYTPYLFEWYLGQDLETIGFDPRLILFSYQYGIAKPSRGLYSLAVEKLNVAGYSVDRVAYIGNDLRNDIVPAQDMGFQTILFAGDARSLRLHKDDPRYENIYPDLQITHLNQLASHLFLH